MSDIGGLLKVRRLSGALGAEVRGVDLARLDDATGAAIRDAFHEHQVLVFPDQDLSPGDQVAFTELFGAVEPHPLRTREAVEGFPTVLILENRKGRPGARNDYWHSDISHAERPPAVTVLHAREVPDGRGDTMFCNMYAAYEALSEGLRETLRGLDALHSAMATYRRSLETNDARSIDSSEIKPPRAHPAVRTHPVTSRPALFVNPPVTIGVDGMTEEESRPLLEPLNAVATRPENVYRHRWRRGDVVMWDNRCVMHYAVMDYTEDMPRLMHRTTAAGEAPR
jgi:taurine dioxygenase